MSEEPQEQAEKRKPGTFPPGQSGNPGGRPKGSINLTTRLRAKLAANPTLVDEILDDLIKQAREGNAAAIKALWDRNDGAVPTEIKADITSYTPEQRKQRVIELLEIAKERSELDQTDSE